MRKARVWLALILAAGVVGCSSSGSASDGGAPTFTITGSVSGQIAAGVTIHLEGGDGANAVTDDSGISASPISRPGAIESALPQRADSLSRPPAQR